MQASRTACLVRRWWAAHISPKQLWSTKLSCTRYKSIRICKSSQITSQRIIRVIILWGTLKRVSGITGEGPEVPETVKTTAKSIHTTIPRAVLVSGIAIRRRLSRVSSTLKWKWGERAVKSATTPWSSSREIKTHLPESNRKSKPQSGMVRIRRTCSLFTPTPTSTIATWVRNNCLRATIAIFSRGTSTWAGSVSWLIPL